MTVSKACMNIHLFLPSLLPSFHSHPFRHRSGNTPRHQSILLHIHTASLPPPTFLPSPSHLLHPTPPYSLPHDVIHLPHFNNWLSHCTSLLFIVVESTRHLHNPSPPSSLSTLHLNCCHTLNECRLPFHLVKAHRWVLVQTLSRISLPVLSSGTSVPHSGVSWHVNPVNRESWMWVVAMEVFCDRVQVDLAGRRVCAHVSWVRNRPPGPNWLSRIRVMR